MNSIPRSTIDMLRWWYDAKLADPDRNTCPIELTNGVTLVFIKNAYEDSDVVAISSTSFFSTRQFEQIQGQLPFDFVRHFFLKSTGKAYTEWKSYMQGVDPESDVYFVAYKGLREAVRKEDIQRIIYLLSDTSIFFADDSIERVLKDDSAPLPALLEVVKQTKGRELNYYPFWKRLLSEGSLYDQVAFCKSVPDHLDQCLWYSEHMCFTLVHKKAPEESYSILQDLPKDNKFWERALHMDSIIDLIADRIGDDTDLNLLAKEAARFKDVKLLRYLHSKYGSSIFTGVVASLTKPYASTTCMRAVLELGGDGEKEFLDFLYEQENVQIDHYRFLYKNYSLVPKRALEKMHWSYEEVKELIKMGADVQLEDNLPLRKAANTGNLKIGHLLLDHGADGKKFLYADYFRTLYASYREPKRPRLR